MTARERLAARRRLVGLTQEDLGEALGVHVQTVAAWEQGRSTPRPWYRTLLAAALGVDMEQLERLLSAASSPVRTDRTPVVGLAGEWDGRAAAQLAASAVGGEQAPGAVEAATRLVHEWLVVEPPQTVELRAGRRIGPRLASVTAERVNQLRHLDDYLSGSDLDAAVTRELAVTGALVREASYSDAVGRQLLRALGDLCQLAGWVAVDAGSPERACRVYATGIAAAHAADDTPLAGQLVSSLSYLLASQGRRADAVLLAESALAGSKLHATVTTRTLFFERLAWAHARVGAHGPAERALAAVDELFGRREPEADPPWTYWLTAEEIRIMAGRCYVELGRPDRAIPALEPTVARYDEERPREAALYLSWLAEAHLQTGDVEQAATLACRVVALTHRTASARTEDRSRHLARLLRAHRATPAVREFLDQQRTRASE